MDRRANLVRQPTTVLKIEVIDSDNEQPQGQMKAGEMSPAFEGNQYKRAAKKMPAVGNESKFPRNDNYYMGMESLSYQELDAKIMLDRPT